MLEQIRGGFYEDGEIREILSGLGYTRKKGKKSLYPEKDALSGLDLDEILVQESLRYGIPSALTAFVCTSERKGRPVKATVIVPSAYPSGWRSPDMLGICASPQRAFYNTASSIPDVSFDTFSCIKLPSDFDSEMDLSEPFYCDLSDEDMPANISYPGGMEEEIPTGKEIGISLDTIVDGVLFEGTLQGWTKISGITVLESQVISAPVSVKIEIFLNAGATPIASISLSDILDGSIRPLNIRLRRSDLVTVTIRDTKHLIANGTIRLELRR